MRFAILLSVLFALPISASATTITFEEFPFQTDGQTSAPKITTEYAPQGVLFSPPPAANADDGIIRGGNSNGDPGNWNLEGTNGPQFLGYGSGPLASAELLDFLFDVTDVSFDVSRSNGTSPGVGLSVTAYLDGVVVDSTLITFGDINQWTTISLDGVFDQIEYHAVSGTSSGSFGVDNLNFSAIPEPSTALLLAFGLVILASSKHRHHRIAA